MVAGGGRLWAFSSEGGRGRDRLCDVAEGRRG